VARAFRYGMSRQKYLQHIYHVSGSTIATHSFTPRFFSGQVLSSLLFQHHSLITHPKLHFYVAIMKFTLIAALPLASAAALPALDPRQNYFSFGNAFSTGPVATNSFIRQSTTTLVLPKLQSPHTGNLGLWPGVGTKFLNSDQDGQLVQGLAISTVGQGYLWTVA